jgi:hypothetical protein
MEPLSKHHRRTRRPWKCSHAHSRTDRSGKIALVTLIAILGLLVLAGFVGNVGHIVITKVKSQNAADAIAFSSAQWMARGMNAITATNHLLGEATALVVVIEGLGGPEADEKMEAYPPQSKITDEVNRGLVDLATINGLAVYGAQAAGKADKKFLNAIVNKLISKDQKHKAFATIYDSKMVLKKKVTSRLIAKSIANAGLWVPPWWGWLTAIPAYAVHIACNVQLAEFGIEFAILEGLERLVTTVVRELKVTIIEDKLIPAIAAHGDYLAGRPSLIAKNRPTADSGIVNYAIRQSLDHLGEVYDVEAAIYPTAITYPGINHLRLPIMPEAPPSMAGTQKNERDWGDDDLKFEDAKDPTAEIKKKMAENKRKIESRIRQLEQGIEFLTKLFNEVQDLKEQTGVNQEERQAFQKEQAEISEDIAAKRKELEQRKKDLEDLKRKEKEIDAALSQLKKAPPGSGNISAAPKHLALTGIQPPPATGGGGNPRPARYIGMNQAEERTTQWVRATYPYVDAFRAPILAMFRENLDECEAAKHYKKWTDRYTLTKSWQFRSGYRFRKAGRDATGNDFGEWFRNTKFQPLTAYVMVERFDPDKEPPSARPGAKRVQKGHEEWTKDTEAAKNMAEDMLSVVAMTHREIEPHFSPVIYPVATKSGMTTFAQAIYYNGNEQTPNEKDKKATTQAKVGWDTLNWDHSKPIPEWGTALTTSPANYPWDLFESSEVWKGNAGVKLNWQAKLMPVTKRRLTPAVLAAGAKSFDMGENVGKSLLFFDQMVTH